LAQQNNFGPASLHGLPRLVKRHRKDYPLPEKCNKYDLTTRYSLFLIGIGPSVLLLVLPHLFAVLVLIILWVGLEKINN
jgi:hypothetical protein